MISRLVMTGGEQKQQVKYAIGNNNGDCSNVMHKCRHIRLKTATTQKRYDGKDLGDIGNGTSYQVVPTVRSEHWPAQPPWHIPRTLCIMYACPVHKMDIMHGSRRISRQQMDYDSEEQQQIYSLSSQSILHPLLA